MRQVRVDVVHSPSHVPGFESAVLTNQVTRDVLSEVLTGFDFCKCFATNDAD